ncbi:MAG TPA: HAD-IIIC family phosphatase [Terracidiphilus sp.]|nr:HAD-IIIC family phosphatase [Terracidiphilus sp.]
MRTLLLSNINMQPLKAFLKPWEVICGEFNSILMDLSNPESAAASAEFSRILCLYDGETMMGDAFYGEGEPEQCESFLSALESFCAAHPEKAVVANTYCFGTGRWLSFADLLHPQSLRAAEARLNERLIAIARIYPNLLLIDTELLFRRYGEDTLLSDSFWYLGRIRYSNQYFRSLASFIHQACDAFASRSRKVLVLDLDNTLWGGILGEAGPLGISLSQDGTGRCYRDFQRALKAVQRTGVLLAICSKNNARDLDQVFERNSMMLLRRDDFACICANWEPKPHNILKIAETLNLDIDSFVFIDDSPVERELMRTSLPSVTVPEFPARTEDLPAWFLRTIVPAWFGKYRLTAEDRGKTRQYKANEERRQLSQALDFDKFLTNLQIECVLHVDPAEQIDRIAQMTQKTNQFNLTTRRYEIPDIRRFLDSPNHAIVLLEYKDRFGPEGAVGLAILDYAELRIDSFLMSCRVIGRKIEDRILSKAFELFQARGCPRIVGEFIPTLKNQQVASFYETHGFTLVSEEADGRNIYERIIT